MKIVFLGTSCMVPTKERNHQAIFIEDDDEGFLVDCGEGTQRQFKIADIKLTKISRLLISHWHGDHVLGIPGLLQTLGASDYDKTLYIYGPAGTEKRMELLFETFSFRPEYDFKVIEIEKDSDFVLKNHKIQARMLKHSVPCIGYSLSQKDKRRIKIHYIKKLGIPPGPLLGQLQDEQKITWEGKIILPEDATYLVKGKKVSVVLDTVLCDNAYKLAEDSDILMAEAVYSSDLIDKAEKYSHMTAAQAAQVASQSNVKKLILTHFSQRYKTTDKIIEEASDIFENVVVAYDMMKIKI